MALLSPCDEPDNAGEALQYFMKGQYEKAAEEHVRYTLDVRDAFQICNGKLKALREYFDEL